MNGVKKEFEDWWNDEEILSITLRRSNHLKSFNYKNIIDLNSSISGTYCDIYQDYYQEDGIPIAIKYVYYHKPEKLIALWQEYKIHKQIYESYIEEGLEPKVIKPLWIKKIAFNNGLHCPVLAIGLERLDETIYEYLKKAKGDNAQSRKWKQEIIQELKRLREKYNFCHRDCHISNVGIVKNNWKMFDFGMSIFNGQTPYLTDCDNVNFYYTNSLPSETFDERILRFSWNEHGDNDEWVTYELKKIANSPLKYWSEGMNVVVHGHPLTKKGTYSFSTERGNVVVSLDIPEKKEKRKINLKYMPPTEYESSVPRHTLNCEFKRKDVLPDITNNFIHYFLPLLP